MGTAMSTTKATLAQHEAELAGEWTRAALAVSRVLKMARQEAMAS